MKNKNKMPEMIAHTCIKWQVDSPFFAEFLLRFAYTEDKNCPTAAIGFNRLTHKLRFIYNPDYLEKQSRAGIEGLCVHEIMHVLHKYGDRVGDRDNDIFNIAQDACINETIRDTTIAGKKLELPGDGGVVLDDIREKIGYKGLAISELVYDALYEKADKMTIVSTGAGGEGQEGEGNCPACGGTGEDRSDKTEGSGSGDGEEEKDGEGSGSGEGKEGKDHKDCPVCGGTGNVDGDKIIFKTTDDHTRGNKKMSDIEKAVVEDIVNNARTRSWGSVSGNMQGTVKSLIKTKRIPWQQKLSKIMSKYVNEPGSIYENSWSKRNRRGLPLPGLRKLSKKILVTVDTSGSVSDADVKMFFGQIEKIVKDYSTMTLIQWDTSVKSTMIYKKGGWKKIKISGRGGTDAQDLYDHLHKFHKNVSIVINFTDAYFNWSFNNYNIPSVWAVINNDDFVAPFGKTVIVKKESND